MRGICPILEKGTEVFKGEKVTEVFGTVFALCLSVETRLMAEKGPGDEN
jgi:hypothetical protein